MTGTVSYLVDCASFQGLPNWSRVAAVCIGGAEKATEGTSYVNPDWAGSKTQMAALAKHGFVPLAYMFMDAAESGAAQADYFASKAGDLTGFGIVVDLERAPDGSPTIAEAQAAVTELRKRYPGHPIGGYAPHWYTGGTSLAFFDWLWASEYVNGSGDPSALYRAVPAAWWAPYGGRTPLLLQFTSSAVVAGIPGQVDCSAFQGTQAQLASHVLPAAPAPAPAPTKTVTQVTGDDAVLIVLAPGATPVTLPVWADASAYKENSPYNQASLILTGGAGAVVKVTLFGPKTPEVYTVTLASGQGHVVVPAGPWSNYGVIECQRLDTKASVPASACYRLW